MIIRQAQLSDENQIIDICVETGTANNNDRELFALRWALYYLRYQTSYCFVAEENDRIIGYILSTPDTKKQEKEYEELILPIINSKIKPDNPEFESYTTFIKNIDLIPDIVKNYPAHLHINLTKACQGRGIGSKLMKEMETNISKNGINGIHLGVMDNNISAIAFYKKHNYIELHKHFLGEGVGNVIFMGKKL